jgi:hypothetical protein
MPIRPMIAATLLAVVAISAGAQPGPGPQGTRIAGTVKSVTAGNVTLATANGDVDIAVTTQTRVLVRQGASISDIKPGAYLGTSNQNSVADSNSGTATEVHLGDNGPNVNSPMNNSGLTMTNGHVKAVTSTPAGKEMDIDYGQGVTRHVLVKQDTVITKMKEAGVASLKAGLEVTAMTTSGTNGKPTATFILIGPAPAPSRP